MSNLPDWSEADKCYSRAYHLLEEMAEQGHVRKTFSGCVTSFEMDKLVEALNKGDEETIKGMLLEGVPYVTF
ncbi:MAG: hypothetical protein V3T26_05995 [candidate division NC10 bacterium]